jgi:hypothetical protein
MDCAKMELMTADARYEKTWHQFLSSLEKQPRLRLSDFLRSQHVFGRGFSKWMYSHGYSVGEAKGRVLQLRMDAQSSAPSDAPSGFLPVDVREDTSCLRPDLLTGISLTLPDGTTVSIRRGSAGAVVSFLKLYSGEGLPCSD